MARYHHTPNGAALVLLGVIIILPLPWSGAARARRNGGRTGIAQPAVRSSNRPAQPDLLVEAGRIRSRSSGNPGVRSPELH
jgi:hypothetical protein